MGMKGHAGKQERETIVRFDDESDSAEIWTPSEAVYRRLLTPRTRLSQRRRRAPCRFLSFRQNFLRPTAGKDQEATYP